MHRGRNDTCTQGNIAHASMAHVPRILWNNYPGGYGICTSEEVACVPIWHDTFTQEGMIHLCKRLWHMYPGGYSIWTHEVMVKCTQECMACVPRMVWHMYPGGNHTYHTYMYVKNCPKVGKNGRINTLKMLEIHTMWIGNLKKGHPTPSPRVEKIV